MLEKKCIFFSFFFFSIKDRVFKLKFPTLEHNFFSRELELDPSIHFIVKQTKKNINSIKVNKIQNTKHTLLEKKSCGEYFKYIYLFYILNNFEFLIY